jgi:hypothetical protein
VVIPKSTTRSVTVVPRLVGFAFFTFSFTFSPPFRPSPPLLRQPCFLRFPLDANARRDRRGSLRRASLLASAQSSELTVVSADTDLRSHLSHADDTRAKAFGHVAKRPARGIGTGSRPARQWWQDTAGLRKRQASASVVTLPPPRIRCHRIPRRRC